MTGAPAAVNVDQETPIVVVEASKQSERGWGADSIRRSQTSANTSPPLQQGPRPSAKQETSPLTSSSRQATTSSLDSQHGNGTQGPSFVQGRMLTGGLLRESGPASRRKDHLPPNKQYIVTHRVPCRHRPKALEREAANEAEQLVDAGGDYEAWVATHTDRQGRSETTGAALEVGVIPDIEMDDAQDDDDVRDMDIDDIPGLEDMQMPSDDESDDDEAARKLYHPTFSPLWCSGTLTLTQ